MATFVLIHGAFHGAWCWVKLVPELEKLGHRVIAPDMPGMGDDRTPLEGLTFEHYVAAVGRALAGAPGRAVLVGHSMAAQAVAQATERWPEKVSRLVYLAGAVGKDGHSLYTLLEEMDGRQPTPGAAPPEGHPWHGLAQQKPPLEQVRRGFYHDCDEADIAYAWERLRTQLNAPRVTPISLTDARYGGVPKTFIACDQDQAMIESRRRINEERIGAENTLHMPTAHSPFFNAPVALAKMLDELA